MLLMVIDHNSYFIEKNRINEWSGKERRKRNARNGGMKKSKLLSKQTKC